VISPGFAFDPAIWFLNHDSGETSASGGMTENVSDIVVTEHQRWTVVATWCVISEHIHLGFASFPVVVECGTWEGRVKQWYA